MPAAASQRVRDSIDTIYRGESSRVLATLIRLLGDFELAEEALHEAFAAAVEQWPRDGIPGNPRAWLVSAGRFKAIDSLRRRARFDASQEDIARQLEELAVSQTELDEREVQDDHLRLIFTCCHPALSPDSQVALTLREICGLTTEEIASAFLAGVSTIAQRIVRAKAKIRDANIPYEIPESRELPERLDSVLRVIYLVFNEGYSASAGAEVTRKDLAAEAIRLGRQLCELLPEPEAQGLLALMLLHDSRRDARSTEAGDLILLEEQDRNLWDREQIATGVVLVEQALATRRFGPYAVQAAIAALHAGAASTAATDWPQVVGLYDVLLQMAPSAVIELNRAVAVAMRDEPQAGIDLIEGILRRGELQDYHLAHAALADLHRRLHNKERAREAYLRALELATQEPERRFLQRRIDALH